MPTGYTYDIKDGINFKTYALNCARAFGACATLLYEPGGGEQIPDKFTPSDYHKNMAESSKKEIDLLASLTIEELAALADKEYRNNEAKRISYIEERLELKRKYEAMLVEVDAWEPPTSDHEEFKVFMREQIEQSIKHDCNTNYYDLPTEHLNWEEYAKRRKEELKEDISYHEKEHQLEVERVNSRNSWISSLRNSL